MRTQGDESVVARVWTEGEIWLRNLSAPIRDVMRFTLVFQGKLPASNKRPSLKAVSDIRGQLSPQLKELWRTHNALKVLPEQCWAPIPGQKQIKILTGSPLSPRQRAEKLPGRMQNLCEPITVRSTSYMPLVRKSLHLSCELDILFLRPEDPGNLYSQGGDLDNRIKTLLDALRKPSEQEWDSKPSDVGFMHVLLEEDSLVSKINVDTDRLLFPQTESAQEAFLIIEVSLVVLQVHPYNTCLL